MRHVRNLYRWYSFNLYSVIYPVTRQLWNNISWAYIEKRPSRDPCSLANLNWSPLHKHKPTASASQNFFYLYKIKYTFKKYSSLRKYEPACIHAKILNLNLPKNKDFDTITFRFMHTIFVFLFFLRNFMTSANRDCRQWITYATAAYLRSSVLCKNAIKL